MSASPASFPRLRARSAAPTTARRLDIAMRVLVAAPGNYAATWLLVTLLARTLPGTALTATLVATLLSFVVFACGVVATFAVRDGGRAGVGLAVIVAAAAAVLALVEPGA